MDLETFKQSLDHDQPPQGLSPELQALWWDGKGNWEQAHQTAQDISNLSGSWIHAYLHRKEGDQFNAGYWYSRAGKPKPSISLEEEWEELVAAML